MKGASAFALRATADTSLIRAPLAAEVTIWDRRGAESFERKYQTKKVTGAEMNQFRCQMPGFGEFDAPLHFVLDVLRSEGYGELE